MKNFKILSKKTYLKMIENSIDSRMFNSIVVQGEDGVVYDLLGDGEFSCASFVSGILVLSQLLEKTRATVSNLLLDISNNSNFQETQEKDILPGDIIFWEKFIFPDGSVNAHVGFYVVDSKAISTSYANKKIVEHHFKNFGENDEERKIEKVFRVIF